jgi:beta-xylosidase
MGVDKDGNGIGEPVASWKKPIPSAGRSLPQTDDDFSNSLGLQWQWNHNPVDTHWSLKEREGWFTLKAMPADSLKLCRNMLTQKVVGYQSESITLLTASGNCYAGLFCSGNTFRGVGLCEKGVFVEAHRKRKVVLKGQFAKLWVRVQNDCVANRHQFSYSTDGIHFIKIGDAFPMRSGYWKGIRVGLFCYGNSGQAAFDSFSQKVCQ